MRKVKWGVIGAGGIFKRRTLPAFDSIENAELVGIMDNSPAVLREMECEYAVPYTYAEEDHLLANPEIEAVYIASPVEFHKMQAEKALAAGKHVLIEKPIGIDVAQSKEIVQLAQNSQLKTGAALMMRFHGAHQIIKRMIADGDLGKIVSCRAQLTCWFPEMENNWRQKKSKSGGGSLMDMGIHCIDLLTYLLDDQVRSVCGYADTEVFQYEVEDSASILMKMKKGAICCVDAYFSIPDTAAKCFLEIYGTKGSVIATGTIGQDGGGEVLLTKSDPSSGYDMRQNRMEEEMVLMPYEKTNMYAKQIGHFSDCILNSTQPEVPLREALECMKIIEAAYDASKNSTVNQILY